MPMDMGQDQLGQDPMADNPINGGSMNTEDPTNIGGQEGNSNDIDDDGFDAGIDVDQEEDPKKYLQQLTGKLSQELRNYNQDQQKPDTELNKYIAGMIIPQSTKDMTDKEKKEIIKKIESSSVADDEGIGDDFIGQDDEQLQDNDMPNESINKMNNIINEIINSFNDEKKERKEKNIKITQNKNINPFVSQFK